MKHFSDHEFACKCGQCGLGIESMDPRLLAILEATREALGKPMRINSAVRCAKHNAAEGGSKGSEHVPQNTDTGKTTGVDIHIPDSAFLFALVGQLYKHAVPRIGLNQSKNFVHVGLSQDHPQHVFFKY